jgi:hypothetical protein
MNRVIKIDQKNTTLVGLIFDTINADYVIHENKLSHIRIHNEFQELNYLLGANLEEVRAFIKAHFEDMRLLVGERKLMKVSALIPYQHDKDAVFFSGTGLSSKGLILKQGLVQENGTVEVGEVIRAAELAFYQRVLQMRKEFVK